MEDHLLRLGLSPLQVTTYLFLLKKGAPQKPLVIARSTGQTRTNCYKVLDGLIELGLVIRRQDGPTYAFEAEDPIALTNIASRARNEAIRLEQQVKSVIPELKDIHGRSAKKLAAISSQQGRPLVLGALMKHAQRSGNLYFIRSRADIPYLGFEQAHKIRTLSPVRYGITPDTVDAPMNPDIDRSSGLHRTWIAAEAYTAPVEWSVHDNEVLIADYSGEGRVIRIESDVVADSFRQIWNLLDDKIKSDPEYRATPDVAERTV